MRLPGELLALVLLVVLFPGTGNGAIQGLHGAEKFYCNGTLINPGETREDVIEKCGDPAWRDVRSETGTDETPGEEASAEETEEWVYDFGHSQLMEFLRFRNGRLVTIRTGIHGFGGARGGDCGYGANLSLGDTKLEVVAKCGDPTGGGTVGEILPPEGTPERRRELLAMDQWVYDFGPDRFVHYLIFRHGRVMEIRSGGLGR